MSGPGEAAVDLQGKFQEFSRTRDEQTRKELIESHLGLACQLARRFSSRGAAYEDLAQVASLALINSVDRFDPDRGVAFSTFATRTILGELKRYFRDKGWSIRAPRRVQELYLEIGHVVESLSQEQGRAPTVSEIAAATGSSEEAVLESLEAGRSYRTASLDAPDHESNVLSDRLGTLDSGYQRSDNRTILAAALAQLPERERRIISLRFVDELTQSEIAERVGMSQMHVSRLLAKSLASVRAIFLSASEEPSSPKETASPPRRRARSEAPRPEPAR